MVNADITYDALIDAGDIKESKLTQKTEENLDQILIERKGSCSP